tara:strand:- start:313 stop:522 length:210 start_codon:yes stop_codon:yes gene_type:complete
MIKVESIPCIGEDMGSLRGMGAKAMLKEIVDLINKYPNDAQLGSELRKYILENTLDYYQWQKNQDINQL